MSSERSGERRKRKRGRQSGGYERKLLPGEKVEVLGTDDGLIGSWHSAVVVSCEKLSRLVEYTDLLSDDNCSKLVEPVPVSAAVDGRAWRTPKKHRGRIRPEPPHHELGESEIKYGLCVDALVDEAWWEGVVFDHNEGSTERLVFFPDQGDEQVVPIGQLRVTQEWNEVSRIWKPRGEWLLLQVLETFEQKDALPVSIRQIWYDLSIMAAFRDDIGVWIFGSRSSWDRLVSELIKLLLSIVRGLPAGGESSKQLIDIPMVFSDVVNPIEDVPCLEGPKHPTDSADTHIILADSSSPQKCATRNSHELTEYDSVENCLGEGCRGGGGTCPLSCSNELIRKQGFFPEAVSDFIVEYENRLAHHTSSQERFKVTREAAKAHLLAVGWKFKTSDLGHKYYVSPSGQYIRSFIAACKTCEEMKSQDISNHNTCNNLICDFKGAVGVDTIHSHLEKTVDVQTKPGVTRFWQPINLEPNYDPEAIKLCASYSSKDGSSRAEISKAARDDQNLVRLRAKKHLRALGWSIETRKDKKIRLRFLSPERNPYYSLHKACCHLLMGHKIKKRKFKGDGRSDPASYMRSSPVNKKKLQIEHCRRTFQQSTTSGDRHTSDRSGKCQKPKKQNSRHDLIRESHKSRYSTKPHLPRSSKRSREVLPSVTTHQVSRTVLSLLIDNDMVLPRQKVRYIRRRDGYIMMEGRITRDGIKCKCCAKIFTLTNFEAHAGSTNHRPAANIFLQDGRSLLQCQMQMVDTKKPINIPNMHVFPHPRLKNDCSVYISDTVCSVCHDLGMLVLCDHCPSSFHLGCVGLKEVVEFCKSYLDVNKEAFYDSRLKLIINQQHSCEG